MHVKNVDLICHVKISVFKGQTHKERESRSASISIDDISFTCGASLQNLELSEHLKYVYTKELSCDEPIKKFYNAAKYPYVCTCCADYFASVPKDRYPQCTACIDKPEIVEA